MLEASVALVTNIRFLVCVRDEVYSQVVLVLEPFVADFAEEDANVGVRAEMEFEEFVGEEPLLANLALQFRGGVRYHVAHQGDLQSVAFIADVAFEIFPHCFV